MEKNTMMQKLSSCCYLIFGEAEIKRARNFHESSPQYTKTPLKVNLDNLAKHI